MAPRASRLATDDACLRSLRLPGAAGMALRRSLARGDLATAVSVVAGHFRTRTAPQWSYYMHATPWLERSGSDVLTKADGLLRGVFHRSWEPFGKVRLGTSPDRVDWARACDALGMTLTRTLFVPELTTAWAQTGQTDYLVAVRMLLRGFVDAVPFVLHDGFAEDHDRFFGGPYHSSLCVGLRVLRWLDLMHCGALRVAEAFSDEDVFWLVKQLWFYACQHHRLCGDPLRRDNHHLTDHGHVPYAMGVMLPELDIAPALRRAGRRVIRHHAAVNLLADGAYAEHCTRYQYHITFAHLHLLACARANGDRLYTAAQETRLERWVGFLAHACRPDGSLAPFGDEAGTIPHNLFDALAAPVMTDSLAATARALGLRPARGGRRAACLPSTARYPQGGFTFFRDRWAPEADYLAVSHYTDSMPHGHTHWDMLSFILHTGGRTLIGDPATWIYNSPKCWSGPAARELRGYLYSVEAHNCLTVDDDTFKPLAHLGHACMWGGHPPRHGLGLFHAEGPIKLAELWHDANHSCRHRRFVLFCPGIGVAFADIVEQSEVDLRPHEYKQTFHFEPGVRLTPRRPGANAGIHVRADPASCCVLPGGEVRACWSQARDDRLRDIPGACEPRTGEGPWVATLTRCQQGPCAFATFLATGTAATRARVEHLGNTAQPAYRQHDVTSVNKLWLGDCPALLLAVNPLRKPLKTGTVETDAELAVIRTGRSGRPTAWLLVRGSHLSLAGAVLCDGRTRPLQTSAMDAR